MHANTGWVLSAFYYGYLVTQIPGGYLADIFGARYVFGLGILLSSVLTIFTPLAAELHIVALISLRVLIGLFEVNVVVGNACIAKVIYL